MRNNKAALTFLLVGLVTLLLAGPAVAATARGQLVFSNNAPAPFVAVRLNAPGKGPSEFAYTGADGKYYLRNVPAGPYQLEVWRGGKVVLTVPVHVEEPVVDLATTRIP